MENNDTLVIEKRKVQDIINFNDDVLQDIYLNFKENFYPVGIETQNKTLEIENSQEFLSNLEFYRIYECTIENTDDLFEYFVNKMKKIFTMFYSFNKEF